MHVSSNRPWLRPRPVSGAGSRSLDLRPKFYRDHRVHLGVCGLLLALLSATSVDAMACNNATSCNLIDLTEDKITVSYISPTDSLEYLWSGAYAWQTDIARADIYGILDVAPPANWGQVAEIIYQVPQIVLLDTVLGDLDEQGVKADAPISGFCTSISLSANYVSLSSYRQPQQYPTSVFLKVRHGPGASVVPAGDGYICTESARTNPSNGAFYNALWTGSTPPVFQATCNTNGPFVEVSFWCEPELTWQQARDLFGLSSTMTQHFQALEFILSKDQHWDLNDAENWIVSADIVAANSCPGPSHPQYTGECDVDTVGGGPEDPGPIENPDDPDPFAVTVSVTSPGNEGSWSDNPVDENGNSTGGGFSLPCIPLWQVCDGFSTWGRDTTQVEMPQEDVDIGFTFIDSADFGFQPIDECPEQFGAFTITILPGQTSVPIPYDSFCEVGDRIAPWVKIGGALMAIMFVMGGLRSVG